MVNNLQVKTIDLFCGAGGSSFGAQSAGADIVAGFDKWATATKAYKSNFPKAEIYEGDIRDLSPNDVKRQIGNVDLILASPECTNHSLAKGNKVRDEDSKRTAFQVTRFAEEFKPKWIILENVVEMESWSEHSNLVDELEALKYSVKPIKLNSADFGVPQARKRLFLLCALNKEVQIPQFEKKRHRAVSRVIDWDGDYKFTPLFKEGRAENTLARAENAISALGKKEPFLMVYYGSGDGWQSVDRPLRTITTLDRFALVIPKREATKCVCCNRKN